MPLCKEITEFIAQKLGKYSNDLLIASYDCITYTDPFDEKSINIYQAYIDTELKHILTDLTSEVKVAFNLTDDEYTLFLKVYNPSLCCKYYNNTEDCNTIKLELLPGLHILVGTKHKDILEEDIKVGDIFWSGIAIESNRTQEA